MPLLYSQVGVYVGCCGSELHAGWLMDVKGITGYEQTGCTLSMFANRLSFSFDFKGPSMAIDTGAHHGPSREQLLQLCLPGLNSNL